MRAITKLFLILFLTYQAGAEACDFSEDRNLPSDPYCYVKNGVAFKVFIPKVNSGEVSWVEAKVKNTSPLTKVIATFEGAKTEFYSLSPGRFGALLAVPFGVRTGRYPIKITVSGDSGEKKFDVPLEVEDGQDEDNVEVLNATSEGVRPRNRAIVERIIQEEIGAERIYASNSQNRNWNGAFVVPIQGKVTSPFGRYRIYTSHLRRRVHWGVDIKAPIGTPVVATASGKVVLAKNQYFGGNTVMIDHGFGLVSTYMHLKGLKVKYGQTINQGELIGWSGISGKTTGPHLHWQIVLNRVKLDPIALLKLRDLP